MAERKKAGPEKGIVETRPFVEYVPAGVRVDPYAGNEPLLDPELEKVREQEIQALSEVKVEPREEPSIDPDLVRARDNTVRVDAKRAKEAGLPTRVSPSQTAEPQGSKSSSKSSK
jgi:hypothetical protein